MSVLHSAVTWDHSAGSPQRFMTVGTAVIVGLFVCEYLKTHVGGVARYAGYLPDVLSVALLVVVGMRAVAGRYVAARPIYAVLFLVFAASVSVSLVLNGVESAPALSGMRTYFKYLPVFLIPAVIKITPDMLETQLKVLLGVLLVQFPMVIYQRFLVYGSVSSGDGVTGTVAISSELSILMLSGIALLTGAFWAGRVGRGTYWLLLIVLFLPTTLNETKGTLVLLPIALAIPMILSSGAGVSGLRRVFLASAFVAALVGLFVPIYNTMYPGSGGVVKFLFTPDKVVHYLSDHRMDPAVIADRVLEGRPINPAWLDSKYKAQRLDSISTPLKSLVNHPYRLAFGLGIGNVSGATIPGRYSDLGEVGAGQTALGQLLWETGVIGVVLVVGFMAAVFVDAKKLATAPGLVGGVAAGWAGVVLLFVVALPYKNVMVFDVLGYLFWYFSGVVVAARVRRQAASGLEGHHADAALR